MTNFAEQAAAAVSAIILLVDYLFGVALGMLGCLIFGSVYENRRMSLLEQAPGPISGGVRVILRLVTFDDGYLRSLPPGRREATRGSLGDDNSFGSPGQEVDQ
jgi:hypothetical protein